MRGQHRSLGVGRVVAQGLAWSVMMGMLVGLAACALLLLARAAFHP